ADFLAEPPPDTRDAGPHDPGAHHATSEPDALCAVVKRGKGAGGPLAIHGQLLLPGGPIDGELLVGEGGTIVCAAASCVGQPGRAEATLIDCPHGVVSPALINSHDHTDYATRAPAPFSDRFDHRNDWRVGAEHATALPH